MLNRATRNNGSRTGTVIGSSYDGKRLAVVVVAAALIVVVGGGGCAAEVVVECSSTTGDAETETCVRFEPAPITTPPTPPTCDPPGEGDPCSEEDRACWPTRLNGCGKGIPGYLCGYPQSQPEGCALTYQEVPPEGGPVPVWCCY